MMWFAYTGDDPAGTSGPPTMNQLGRPALVATIRAGGRDLTVVNCHLKSKLLSYPPGPSGATRFNPRDERERAKRSGAPFQVLKLLSR